MRRARRERDIAALAPSDPADALEAHHLAERFDLFLIILLGEVVVEAGQAALEGGTTTAGGWGALTAAMVLAGALWWVYFDSVADINLKVLQLSGGSPSMARAIFAVGHMLPAFALLLTAAGVGLLLEHDPPRIAFWLACVGLGIYLAGTRAFLLAPSRLGGLARLADRYATRAPISPRSCRTSASWIAFVAAPLRRLSDTIHRSSACSWPGSRRMRPTKTSSWPSASIAIG
jgi:hypothetical protein